ncbi:unnamed protein product [Pleuronectes platessa]|uniref:Uncharacterized protein n=1 Tax=Pleuronectes platessa TaxID=8262 RepID=A0A9N7VRS3_PLEPL|nr:unnamed protein product [Pleuronectes platessa]
MRSIPTGAEEFNCGGNDREKEADAQFGEEEEHVRKFLGPVKTLCRSETAACLQKLELKLQSDCAAALWL